MSIPHSYIYDKEALCSYQSFNDEDLLSELCLDLLPVWDYKFKYFDGGLSQERFNADDYFIFRKLIWCKLLCYIFTLNISSKVKFISNLDQNLFCSKCNEYLFTKIFF